MSKVLFFAVVLLAWGAVSAAWASRVSSTSEVKVSDHGAASAEHGAEPAKAADKPGEGGLFAGNDNLVPLPTIIAPVVIKDRLGAHLYLFLAAVTDTASDAQIVKTRLPYVQDAMVRDVYLHKLAIDDIDQDPDTAALLARLKDVINTAVGEPLVTEIQVGRIDTAPY